MIEVYLIILHTPVFFLKQLRLNVTTLVKHLFPMQ